MTKRFEGNIKVDISDNKVNITLPTNTNLPDKREFSSYSIYETNGKRWYAVSNLAKKNLDDCVKKIENAGFKAAHKSGSRKNTSIKYGILTHGIEDFQFV